MVLTQDESTATFLIFYEITHILTNNIERSLNEMWQYFYFVTSPPNIVIHDFFLPQLEK